MKASNVLYEASGLEFTYQLGTQRVKALSQVSLSLAEGAFVCLSGPSGSGKTTLLNVLGMIEPVQEGELRMQGKSIGHLSEEEKNHIRRFQIGFIFQTFHLFPVLTASENVEFFLSRQGVARPEREKRVKEALNAVGLWEHRDKRPLEMSGGQRQRVAIARAVAKSPRVLLADEPTASLDQKTGREIMEILRELNESRGVTIILSSHDPMAQSFAKDIVRLRDGQILSAKEE